PAPPEVVANAYGTPLAKLSGRPCRSLDWDQSYKGREGVWHADTVELAMEIPNRQVLDGYKEIWVEAIFRGYLDGVSVSENPQGTTVIPLGQTITALDKHWKRLNIGWRLEPNPYSEIVYLSFRDSGGCIDSVIVETNCVPEPATLLLLSLGGLALLRKRRTQTHLLS
ncbi:MAG: PEP-CTERM sorting domain-containing protein, partial [Desulfobacterales bacterium]|nr:PEP-CTERM sorting domain-containing protein [Desulfobacterales bacterium]